MSGDNLALRAPKLSPALLKYFSVGPWFSQTQGEDSARSVGHWWKQAVTGRGNEEEGTNASGTAEGTLRRVMQFGGQPREQWNRQLTGRSRH